MQGMAEDWSGATVTALHARIALELELGRAVDNLEILEWLVYGVPTLSRRAAEVLRTENVDRVLASLEATLMEKLAVQEAVYGKLRAMLTGRDEGLRGLAAAVLAGSTSSEAAAILAQTRTLRERLA